MQSASPLWGGAIRDPWKYSTSMRIEMVLLLEQCAAKKCARPRAYYAFFTDIKIGYR